MQGRCLHALGFGKRVCEGAIERLEIRRVLAKRREMCLNRLPIAAGNGSRQFEPVIDDAPHEWQQSFGRCAGDFEHANGRTMERDEIVRCRGGPCVIQGAEVLMNLKRDQVQFAREPDSSCDRLFVFSRYRGPRSIELFRPAIEDDRLQRMKTESLHMRRQRGKRRCAAGMGDPWTRLNRSRDLTDCRIGHTHQHEFRIVLDEPMSSFDQTCGDRAANASASDDAD